jgi:hypothetical protein
MVAMLEVVREHQGEEHCGDDSNYLLPGVPLLPGLGKTEHVKVYPGVEGKEAQ